MSCSRTQHGAACGDQTQDLSIRSPTLYHYATMLPSYNNETYTDLLEAINTEQKLNNVKLNLFHNFLSIISNSYTKAIQSCRN